MSASEEHSKLGAALRKKRESSNLTVDDLTGLRDGSPSRQHLYAIEKTGKVSLDMLGALVRKLYTRTNEDGQLEVDTLGLLKLAGDAFEIDLDLSHELRGGKLHDEEVFQKELKPRDTVWIVSDTLAETKSASILQNTIEGISDSGLRYTYFVPTGNQAWLGLFEEFKKKLSKTALKEQVRFVELTPYAFPCRMRIARPGRSDQNAVYVLQIPDSEEYRYYPAPPDVIFPWVREINLAFELVNRVEMDARGSTTNLRKVYTSSLGKLELLYPSPNLPSEDDENQ